MTQTAPANTITIAVDGRQVTAPAGSTILEAAALAGIYIPTLCYDERLKPYGACRMCLVEQEGRPGFAAACVAPAAPDAAYRTNSDDTVELRQSVLNLLMSEHPHGCLTCDRVVHCGPNDICLRNVSVTDRCVVCPQNQRCELQATVEIVGVTEQLLPYNYRDMPIRTEDPHIDRDYNLCISCARCVRVCDEIIGAEAISMVDRGDRILPGTPNDVPLSDPLTGCTFCGACVDVCPVGALTEKDNKWAGLPDANVTTVCTECEIGCQVTAELKDGRLLRVTPDIEGGANGGFACIHGKFELANESNNEARLINAMILDANGALGEASWDDAITAAAEGLRARAGDSAALVISPRVANEDAYVLNRLAHDALQTQRVAIAATGPIQAGRELAAMFGNAANASPIRDIAKARAVLVVGSDIELTHPVASYQIHKAVNYNDATLIGIGSGAYPELGRASERWLTCAEGTEHAVLRGILRALLDANLVHDEFLEESVDGLADLTESLAATTVEDAATEASVSADDLRWAARIIGTSAPLSVIYGAREEDAPGLAALVAALATLTGNVSNGQGGGLHVLRPGGGNVQGVSDILGADASGLNEIIESIEAGTVTALYWTGDIPADMADDRRARLVAALARLEFLVVQGLVIADELASIAHVLIPAAAAVEREGTYTNAERRVQRVRPIKEAPGDAQPVWRAPADIARQLGATDFGYSNANDILVDITAALPNYVGITSDVLDSALTGPTWPLQVDGTDERLYQGATFGNASGRIRLAAL